MRTLKINNIYVGSHTKANKHMLTFAIWSRTAIVSVAKFTHYGKQQCLHGKFKRIQLSENFIHCNTFYSINVIDS